MIATSWNFALYPFFLTFACMQLYDFAGYLEMDPTVDAGPVYDAASSADAERGYFFPASVAARRT